MESEISNGLVETLDQLAGRLNAAIELLERTIPQRALAASGTDAVGPIVATVDASREAELAEKLAEAEKTIAELRASSGSREGRKTLQGGLLAKQEGGGDPGALDAALTSLSLEQRIAVKAHLMRSGLV